MPSWPIINGEDLWNFAPLSLSPSKFAADKVLFVNTSVTWPQSLTPLTGSTHDQIGAGPGSFGQHVQSLTTALRLWESLCLRAWNSAQDVQAVVDDIAGAVREKPKAEHLQGGEGNAEESVNRDAVDAFDTVSAQHIRRFSVRR